MLVADHNSPSWGIAGQPIQDRRMYPQGFVDEGVEVWEFLQVLVAANVLDHLELVADFGYV